ncbi:bile acid:sodium symporter [Gammaproteobacteria bacterium 45_16_T64]|nr:bile acid:sodium symporter [Gammaproteobacteria bacterium 45_16_T64]
MQASMLTQVILPLSLFVIMLGMGLSLKLDDFRRVLQEPKAIAIGILCQMVMLPLLAYVIIVIFGLTKELAVGLMILAFCPGGTTSNLISYLSRGDVALSISLTAVISIVTPFSIPIFTALMMELFLEGSEKFSIPVIKTIIQLLVITVVPVVFGMLIHHKFPGFSKKAENPVKIFSVIFLFVIIAGIVINNKADMAGFFMQTSAATLTLNIVTLLAGYSIAKLLGLEKRQAITLGIEVGVQNGTVALLVAGSLIGSAVMTIPAVTYSLLMFITGGVFGWLVNRQ